MYNNLYSKQKGPIDWDNIEEVRERYAENREAAASAFTVVRICFVFTMLTSLIPAIVLTVGTLYNLFGRAVGYGIARIFIGDDAVRDGVRTMFGSLPIVYLAAIWIIGITSLVSYIFEADKPHSFLKVFYLLITAYALVSIFFGSVNITTVLLCVAYGIVGFCAEDLTQRRLLILKELSKEPGYPKFLDYFDRTHTINNTTIKYVDYHEKLKAFHEKDIHEGVKIQYNLAKTETKPEEFIPGVMPELVPPDLSSEYESERQNLHPADINDGLFDD
jgi:hypothetical protein